MKNFATKLIAVLKAVFANSIIFINEQRLTTKLIAVFLMTALLMPLIFLGDWQKASAQSQTFSQSAKIPAPVAAPPQAFVLPSSESVSKQTLAAVSNFNTLAVGGYSKVLGAVTAPALPEGFELAKPVSPLYLSISSTFSSIGSTLGAFFGLSTNTIETTTKSATLLTTQTANNNTEYDFDGDGKSDIARWKASTLEWQIKNSNGGSLTTNTLGSSGAVLAPGDFDGDLKTDVAVFNSGVWTIKPSGGGAQYTISFGAANDIPVTGDYNGDGRSDYV